MVNRDVERHAYVHRTNLGTWHWRVFTGLLFREGECGSWRGAIEASRVYMTCPRRGDKKNGAF